MVLERAVLLSQAHAHARDALEKGTQGTGTVPISKQQYRNREGGRTVSVLPEIIKKVKMMMMRKLTDVRIRPTHPDASLDKVS
jgi:hypothetical protein